MPWKQDYTISDEVAIADDDIVWPAGNRCCFNLVVDLNPAVKSVGATTRDISAATYQYGMSEGIDLLLDLLARLELRATFATPALVATLFPERMREIVSAGHEIAGNGLLGEDIHELDAKTERLHLTQAMRMLAEATGSLSQGWYALPRTGDAFATGNVSARTMDLLIEAGCRYFGNGLADDAPHYWVADFTARKTILALPYYYHFDDRFFLMFPADGTGLERPDVLERNWEAQFRAQYRRGRYFSLTLSPARSGWGHRLENLEMFLSKALRMPGLWNATSAEVAAYWLQRYPASTHLKLEPSIWKSYEGSLD